MPDDSGRLTAADLPTLNTFIGRETKDGCLTCPVTGARVPIEHWRISDRLCMLPVSGAHLKPNLTQTSPVISCTSPAGGVVFLDALKVGIIQRVRSH